MFLDWLDSTSFSIHGAVLYSLVYPSSSCYIPVDPFSSFSVLSAQCRRVLHRHNLSLATGAVNYIVEPASDEMLVLLNKLLLLMRSDMSLAWYS